MKTKLTIEQSQRLIEAGISIDKASDSDIFDEPCHRAYMPIFTLTDLLQILPKKNSFVCAEAFLSINFEINFNEWCVQYLDFDHDDCTMAEECAPELIDAIYSLIVWIIENWI